MKENYTKKIVCLLAAMMIALFIGCGKKEEARSPDVQISPPQAEEPADGEPDAALAVQEEEPQKQEAEKDVVVSVDGKVLKKAELAANVKNKMKPYKDMIPADKIKELEQSVRKQLLEEFVVKTVLQKEADRKKITATQKDIETFYDEIKSQLPPDKELSAFLKENNVTRDDIVLGIKIRKLVAKEMGAKTAPTEKEIKNFYKENADKFKTDETVHVRHILVTLDPKDDENTKAEKREKIEKLRKKILDGADFAEVARENSECPSKENGGDLGEIKKDQTVKPFEDAAFDQQVNVVGPVVTTEFGYHVIEVLGKTPENAVPLDEVKDSIALHLEQQKEADVFGRLLEGLRKKADIIYYEN
jgi:peptidyl-prolyl cis-trans isomerase C